MSNRPPPKEVKDAAIVAAQRILHERDVKKKESEEVFHLQQDLLLDLSNLRVRQQQLAELRDEYAKSVAAIVKKECALVVEMEEMAEAEDLWEEDLLSCRQWIAEGRQLLLESLQRFKLTRKIIQQRQSSSLAVHDHLKLATKDSVTIISQGRSLFESELRKAPIHTFPSYQERAPPLSGVFSNPHNTAVDGHPMTGFMLPSKKSLLKLIRTEKRKISKQRSDIRQLHLTSILEMRRKERILMGRCREWQEHTAAQEQTWMQISSTRSHEADDKNGNAVVGLSNAEKFLKARTTKFLNSNHASQITMEMMRPDSLENRVAKRLLETTLRHAVPHNALHRNTHLSVDSELSYSDELEAKSHAESVSETPKPGRFLEPPDESSNSHNRKGRTILLPSTGKVIHPTRNERQIIFQQDGLLLNNLVRKKINSRGEQRSPRLHSAQRPATANARTTKNTFNLSSSTIQTSCLYDSQTSIEHVRSKTPSVRKRVTHTSFHPSSVYDPSVYMDMCSGEHIRRHTLLDMDKGIGEGEEHLSRLATLCCNARGKAVELTTIKEGLDTELVKQATALLAVMDTLLGEEGEHLQLPLRTNSSAPNFNPRVANELRSTMHKTASLRERIHLLLSSVPVK